MPTWPESLPTSALIEGFGETPGSNLIESEVDVGAPMRRQRGTGVEDEVKWPIHVTRAQWNTLLEFWRKDLASGAIPFERTHPIDGTPITIYIVSLGTPNFLTHDKMLVTMEVKVRVS